MSPEQSEAALNILRLIALADGNFCAYEMDAIESYAESEGLDAGPAIPGDSSDQWGSNIPDSYEERCKLLLTGIQVMWADGRVHPAEKKLCEALADVLGFDKEVVNAVSITSAAESNRALNDHWLGDTPKITPRNNHPNDWLTSKVGIDPKDLGQAARSIRAAISGATLEPEGQDLLEAMLGYFGFELDSKAPTKEGSQARPHANRGTAPTPTKTYATTGNEGSGKAVLIKVAAALDQGLSPKASRRLQKKNANKEQGRALASSIRTSGRSVKRARRRRH